MTRARQLADAGVKADYLDNVASDINTQLNAKAPLASPTFTGTIGGGAIGSAVTGFAGIKNASLWYVDTTWTGSASTAIVNWSEADFNLPAKIGSSMTQSSGIFTFPQTGQWHIEAWVNFRVTSVSSAYNSIVIDSSSNTGASWVQDGIGYVSSHSVADFNSTARAVWILDVTNTSTQRVKFRTATASGSMTQVGSSSTAHTGAIFIRLGDT